MGKVGHWQVILEHLTESLKGIFDKYLDTVHIQDDSLIKPCELSDWISYQSRFTRSNETNEYSLVLLKASVLYLAISESSQETKH